jgi:serine phosphatase RsbU (regulator of sigma subunit)
VVEGGTLLRCYTSQRGIEGSNPSSSAPKVPRLQGQRESEVEDRERSRPFLHQRADMFVTCFYAILEPKNGQLSYANAGHDLPYLRIQGGECEQLRARGMPLGLMPGMSYEGKETQLGAGEVALFYSDGLVEAHDPEREMFGFPRLKALVAKYGEVGR